VWRYTYENDLIVVTTNAKDFLALLDVEVHPGLIVLRESGLSREEQWDRIEPALQWYCNICLVRAISISSYLREILRPSGRGILRQSRGRAP
jgi:predicted nuclease of predicted toxin-antitoxin system